jgi:hypothetical protein
LRSAATDQAKAGQGATIADRVTAMLAAQTEPTMRIEVTAARSSAAQEQLRDWAADNRARIVHVASTLDAAAESDVRTLRDTSAHRALAMLQSSAPEPTAPSRPIGSQQVIVELDESQVSSLVDYLDAPAEQRAQLLLVGGRGGAIQTTATPTPLMKRDDTLDEAEQTDIETSNDQPFSSFGIDWDQILPTQALPQAPVEHFEFIDRGNAPQKRVQVVVEVIEAPIADEGETGHKPE